MKKTLIRTMAIALLIGSTFEVAAQQSNIEKYAHITQDSISLNGTELKWNGSITTMEDIENQIKSSYSLNIRAYNANFDQLMTMLAVVKNSGIEDRFIILSLLTREETEDDKGVDDLFAPKKEKKPPAPAKQTTWVKLKENGQLFLSDKPIELADLTTRLPDIEEISFACVKSLQFSRVYEVLQILNQTYDVPIYLTINLRMQVRVEAQLIERFEDGTEKKLSSPALTTLPGNIAIIGVHETQPQTNDDLYQQNGYSGGGVSFKALPQFIGNHIKVTGSIAVKRIKGSEAFKLDDQPIRNYSTETIVIPFSTVFDKNTDAVELDPIEIDGRTFICQLKAFHVSNVGKKIRPVF